MDDVLRMNHVQAVGTHNSYHVDPANGVPPWSYTHRPLDEQLEEQGVRQFELDLYYYGFETPSHFEVFHLPSADDETTCRMFVDCLRRLADWSDAHPAHHPIVILLEPKDDFGRRPALAELSGPGHEEDHHARIGDSSRKIAKTFPRGGICQMGVIEKDHHRLTLCQVGYQRGESCD